MFFKYNQKMNRNYRIQIKEDTSSQDAPEIVGLRAELRVSTALSVGTIRSWHAGVDLGQIHWTNCRSSGFYGQFFSTHC